MIIAVDFDGTLCEDKFPDIGAPKWEIIKGLQLLQEHTNYTIILWTCRVGEKLQEAIKWCEEHQLHFDHVNENASHNVAQYGTDPRKIFADVYIDDKAMGFSQARDFLSLISFLFKDEEDEVHE